VDEKDALPIQGVFQYLFYLHFELSYKRLEQGRFSTASLRNDGGMELPELMLVLEGIDLAGARCRKRFRLPEEMVKNAA